MQLHDQDETILQTKLIAFVRPFTSKVDVEGKLVDVPSARVYLEPNLEQPLLLYWETNEKREEDLAIIRHAIF